tara:strand:- start:76 stop:264 length:189 start_codon:yes stop_codon:yes gene_type:complete
LPRKSSKLTEKTGKVSVKMEAYATAHAKLGNEKIKVAGKKVKLSGVKFEKKVATLVKQVISN